MGQFAMVTTEYQRRRIAQTGEPTIPSPEAINRMTRHELLQVLSRLGRLRAASDSDAGVRKEISQAFNLVMQRIRQLR